MSKIINAAVASINEQRSMEAGSKATKLILAIDHSNAVIKEVEKNINSLQEELKKLAHDKYNAVEIIGTLPDSQAAKTIVETINRINKLELDSVACQCSELDSSIRSAQATLENEKFNREELRKKLLNIKVESVTAETIA